MPGPAGNAASSAALPSSAVAAPPASAPASSGGPAAPVGGGVVATRTDADNAALEKTVGCIIYKYFPGYGYFRGKVRYKVPGRPVVDVQYEDGDSEELYLDQVMEVLVHDDSESADDALPASDDPGAKKYGYTWPPPALSARLAVNEGRRRKPSEAAIQQMLWEQTQQFEREMARVEREQKKKEAAEMRQRAKEKRQAEAQKKKETAAALKNKPKDDAAASQTKRDQANAAAAKKPGAAPRKRKAAAANGERAQPAKRKRPSAAAALTGGPPATSAASAAAGDAAAATATTSNELAAANARRRRKPSASASSNNGGGGSTAAGRRWTRCGECELRHWDNEPCPALRLSSDDSDSDNDDNDDDDDDDSDRGGKGSSQQQASRARARGAGAASSGSSPNKRWSGTTTRGLVEALKAQRAAQRQSGGDAGSSASTSPPPASALEKRDSSSSMLAALCSAACAVKMEEETGASSAAVANPAATDAAAAAAAAAAIEPLAELAAAQPSLPDVGAEPQQNGTDEGADKHAASSSSASAPPANNGTAAAPNGGAAAADSAVAAATTTATATAAVSDTQTPASSSSGGAVSEACGGDGGDTQAGGAGAAGATAAAAAAVTAPPAAASGLACSEDEQRMTKGVYRVIKSKVDVISGGDGYGMTGNVTRGSMAKLLEILREQFGLDSSASFFDLGSGMGRPNMHVACMHPHVSLSFGTEFNPQLYKQAMLALRDCSEKWACIKSDPRVFFMDANIKDLSSLNPFTHVYAFNIGMPEDVVEHLLQTLPKSRSVKYAILYPHRSANLKRLQQIGTVRHSISMSMPGGCSYEAVVLEIHHRAEAPPTSTVDVDIANALEIVGDRELYSAYLSQLGIATDLDAEQHSIRATRRQRRNVANTHFLAQSPCIPDIDLGLLRRVARTLGVSTVGNKIKILSNIQEYVPVTFSLPLFALGTEYTDATVQKIVDKLLSVQPARRQPEAMH